MQSIDEQWISPSFNSYSQNTSAETAVRVTGEVDGDNLASISEIDEDEDFVFSLLVNNEEFEPAGEAITFTEKYQPKIFPVFNRDLLNDYETESCIEKVNTIQVPLRRLFIEEREDQEPRSSSSSEGEEAESVPPGTYCVCRKKAIEASPSTCKKSKSTGSRSKRWRLRDLLKRSNSEGKDSFVFLTPKPKPKELRYENNRKSTISKAAKALLSSKKSTTVASTSVPSSPPRRLLYSPENRAMVGGDETPNRSPNGNETPRRTGKGKNEMPRRKSYLPYRQDLLGFFTTVNSLGRNFTPV